MAVTESAVQRRFLAASASLNFWLDNQALTQENEHSEVSELEKVR